MKNPRLGPWVITAFIVIGALSSVGASNDKILLSDVRTLMLHQGQMTNARRSSPVPQLECVGGSAQHRFQPKVVQCINQGSDGYDMQWECKTEMDNAYRFGEILVSCEGYDYPEDPYVLMGSCGLEYTIEFTEEGLAQERQRAANNNQNGHKSEGGLGGLFVCSVIAFLIFVVYNNFQAPNHGRPTQEFMPPQDSPPSYESSAPPPPVRAPTPPPPNPPRPPPESTGTRTASGFGGTRRR